MEKILSLLQLFCYFFILGIAIPTFLYPKPVVNFWYVFIPIAALCFILRKRIKIVCMIVGLILGAWRYFNTIDISSPFHITNYLDKSTYEESILRATIIRDPDIREKYAWVDVKPEYIQTDPLDEFSGVELKGKTGYVRVKVYPTIGPYYYAMEYGDRIEIKSAILEPFTRTNPAGFDFRRYLHARNCYATATVSNPEEIKYLGVGELNPIVKFSFSLRERMLSIIRQTMPYPESAFLSGVTLGLRGGVPPKMRTEFQATGIAHVLALSGLHVGFIALLLYAICNLFGIGPLPRFFGVIMGLLIFTLLTGATPATQRAALMYILGLFFIDILKLKMGRSTKLTVPISAFIVLWLNPLWLPDASFVLSYMAVISLVYITPVIQSLLIYKRKRVIHEFITFPLFTVIFGATLISLIGGILKESFLVSYFLPFLKDLKPLSYYFPSVFGIHRYLFLSISLWLLGILVAFIYRYNTRWVYSDTIINEMCKSRFLRSLLTFVCSQIAIQLGMMWPLSGVYFYRFPIAGFYTNFLAIPLIGVIVQIGWIAGLFGLIFSILGLSSIGEFIALTINAANWNLSQIFIGIGKVWNEFVPYPYIGMYSWRELVLWYSLILVLVLHYKIYLFLRDVFLKYKRHWKKVLISFAVLVIFIYSLAKIHRKQEMMVIIFDVGLGNSLFIRTPGGKNILIDTGPYRHTWDAGSTVIGPTFSRYMVKNLDCLILTSLTPQSWGNSEYIIKNFTPDVVYIPPKLFELESTDYISFLKNCGIPENPIYFRRKDFIKFYELFYTFKKISKDYNVKMEPMKTEPIIFDEVSIIPLVTDLERKGDISVYSVPLKIKYKDFSILVGSHITADIEKKLIDTYGKELISNILISPRNGHPSANSEEFIRYIFPEIAIIQYGWNPYISYPEEKLDETLGRYAMEKIKTTVTSKYGAITCITDGKKYKLTAILKPIVMEEKIEDLSFEGFKY